MMSETQQVIISDASCLILLHKIGELELLKLVFKEILITDIVAQEYGNKLPSWIVVKTISTNLFSEPLSFLDKGEASSILLAMKYPNSLLIIDELKGRKIAQNLEIPVTGTLGVIIQAKRLGILKSIKPVLKKIAKSNFRINRNLIQKALKLANEE